MSDAAADEHSDKGKTGKALARPPRRRHFAGLGALAALGMLPPRQPRRTVIVEEPSGIPPEVVAQYEKNMREMGLPGEPVFINIGSCKNEDVEAFRQRMDASVVKPGDVFETQIAAQVESERVGDRALAKYRRKDSAGKAVRKAITAVHEAQMRFYVSAKYDADPRAYIVTIDMTRKRAILPEWVKHGDGRGLVLLHDLLFGDGAVNCSTCDAKMGGAK